MHRLSSPFVWLLIAGFFIDAINIDEIIGLHEMVHEEYEGESITSVLENQNTDDSIVISVSQTHKAVQNQSGRASHNVQWIDADSLSVAASVVFESEELPLIVTQRSAQWYCSTFTPVSTPVTLGKLLI